MSRTPLKTYPEASALLGWSEKGMYWRSWRLPAFRVGKRLRSSAHAAAWTGNTASHYEWPVTPVLQYPCGGRQEMKGSDPCG